MRRPSKWSQLRRCHRCGAVHEHRGDRVKACTECGAQFAPFYFADTTPLDLLRKPRPPGLRVYRPLVGIVEWWSDTAVVDPARLPQA